MKIHIHFLVFWCTSMLCSVLESVLPVCWNSVQLKGTMCWIYFNMNKAFVWGAHILNRGPESRSSFELSGQRHHRTDALFRIHLVPHTEGPVTFVLLIVLHFFKGLAATIGQLEAFICKKKEKQTLHFHFYSSLQGKNCTGGFSLPQCFSSSAVDNNCIVFHSN